MALEKEMETYKSRLAALKDQEGKFALVHGEDVDVFATYEDAIREGYRRFGRSPFLVKQIQAVEQVQFVSRFVDAPALTLAS